MIAHAQNTEHGADEGTLSSFAEEPISMKTCVREAQEKNRANITKILDDAGLADECSYGTAISTLHTMQVEADETTLWGKAAFEAFKSDMSREIITIEQNAPRWKQALRDYGDKECKDNTLTESKHINYTGKAEATEQPGERTAIRARVRKGEAAHLEIMSIILEDDLCQRYYDETYKHIKLLMLCRPLDPADWVTWTEADFQAFDKSLCEEAIAMDNYLNILRLRKEREDFEKGLPERLKAKMMTDLKNSSNKTRKGKAKDDAEQDEQVSIFPDSGEDYSDAENLFAVLEEALKERPALPSPHKPVTRADSTRMPPHEIPAKPPAAPEPSAWDTIAKRQTRMKPRPQPISIARADALNDTCRNVEAHHSGLWRPKCLSNSEPSDNAQGQLAANQELWQKERDKESWPQGLAYGR